MKVSKFLAVASAVLAWVPVASHAQAVCTASGAVVMLTQAQIGTLLTGKVLCGRPGSSYPNAADDRWQEEHHANGDLFDYKRGPTHPTDPRTKVGTWNLGGSRLAPSVTYAYGPTTAFSWRVFGPTLNVPGSSVYSFCTTTGTAQHVRAYIITSATGCSSFPP